MRRGNRIAATSASVTLAIAATATAWIAFPYRSEERLAPPLERVTEEELSRAASPYGADLQPLMAAFQPQSHRSFCGPATLATVLRAGGHPASEWALFSAPTDGLRTFYGGMSLEELANLAQTNGLRGEIVRGNELTVESFRERLKQNLENAGDYVIVNYDRRALNQTGAGHISAVGDYDPNRDTFLILDQALYRYPWTWVPTQQLYQSVRTLDGETYRGVLFIEGENESQKRR